jgi:predicted transcriptional regulator
MGRPRDSAQIAAHRRQIADLYLRGRLQAEIAEQVGISQSTVSRDLKALQGEWLRSALMDFNEAKARELAKIDHLERTYWAAWQRSQEDAETEATKAIDVKDGKRYEVATQRKGQAGDPRFLQGVQWCIERRCKIIGVDAPDRHEHSGTGGGPIRVQDEHYNRAISALIATVREGISGAGPDSDGAMGAAE